MNESLKIRKATRLKDGISYEVMVDGEKVSGKLFLNREKGILEARGNFNEKLLPTKEKFIELITPIALESALFPDELIYMINELPNIKILGYGDLKKNETIYARLLDTEFNGRNFFISPLYIKPLDEKDGFGNVTIYNGHFISAVVVDLRSNKREIHIFDSEYKNEANTYNNIYQKEIFDINKQQAKHLNTKNLQIVDKNACGLYTMKFCELASEYSTFQELQANMPSIIQEVQNYIENLKSKCQQERQVIGETPKGKTTKTDITKAENEQSTKENESLDLSQESKTTTSESELDKLQPTAKNHKPNPLSGLQTTSQVIINTEFEIETPTLKISKSESSIIPAFSSLKTDEIEIDEIKRSNSVPNIKQNIDKDIMKK